MQCRDFYWKEKFLSSGETSIYYRDLTNIETFAQCIDFYPVLGLLSSAETFIKCRDFYPV